MEKRLARIDSAIGVLVERGGRTERYFCYVFTLTKKGGTEVMAIRADGYKNKTDAYKVVTNEYPDWKVKNVLKLYESDFWED